MHEQFLNEIKVAIKDIVPSNELSKLINIIGAIANDYDLSKKSRELMVYEPFPEEAKMFLVAKTIGGMAQGSTEQYYRVLSEFFKYVQKPINQVKANDIRTYLYLVQKDRGISNRTLEGRRTIIHSFFEWLAAEDYIPKNPARAVDIIRYSSEPREPLNAMELEMVRASCVSMRDKALVEFFYSTACRVSEAVSVNVEDIDFNKGELVVLGKGNKYRTVYLNARCILAITSYLKDRGPSVDGSLFCSERNPKKRLQKRAIEDRIKIIGKRAGLNRPLFPHLIRHTFATDGLNKGMDLTEVQQVLGHSNINTTLTYSKVSSEKTKSNFMKYIT